MTKKLLLLVVLLFVSVPAFAQSVDTAWVRRYSGPGNFEDMARAIAVDGSGNVYVTGWSTGSVTHFDYATIKYYPNGDTAWVRRYNGPANDYDLASAIAVDSSGNVYVTGSSYGIGTSSDYATIKYYPNGDTAWVRRYNGPGNSSDQAHAIAIDGSGNVYVTGGSFGIDYATIKYDPAGTQLWVQRYNGPGNSSDEARAIAVDGSGNVYVTGRSGGIGTAADYATIKYDSQGNELWVRRYNGAGNSDDEAYAIAIDGSGNVYVTGSSIGSATYSDYATIKYDPAGTQLWVKRYNGPGNYSDDASAIAVDGSGNVYVTGGSWGSGTGWDYTTIKYDPQGNELWVKRYNGPVNSSDLANAIAVDGSGYVYVTGRSYGRDWDYATIKYRQGTGMISGTKFYDVNGNGIQDAGEVGLPGWMIILNPGWGATLTDANGNYSFRALWPGTYIISEVLKPNWQQTCPVPIPPGTYTVPLSQGQTVTGKDFGNIALANVQDLSVDVAGGRARPGFQKKYAITYQNKSIVPTNGTVILALPPQVTHVQSSPGGVYNVVFHSVTWNVGVLAPGFRGWLWTRVLVPATVPIGTVLTTTATIEPIAGDANPADNKDIEKQTVRGSFDPNEKLVTPEGGILRTDTLRYQINFQNVGTDTAFNIVVRDTLDTLLDITTLESGASSHPYAFNIVGRELSWTFANINLPDSNVNEPGSHGFLTFEVRPRSDVSIGAEIENRSAIYFDFNPPVITNTVQNRIFMRGDVNADASITLVDVIYLANYVLKGGPAPIPLQSGDVNCDGKYDLVDVIKLARYVLLGELFPC